MLREKIPVFVDLYFLTHFSIGPAMKASTCPCVVVIVVDLFSSTQDITASEEERTLKILCSKDDGSAFISGRREDPEQRPFSPPLKRRGRLKLD